MSDSRLVLADNIKAMLEKDGLSVRGFAMRHKLQQKAMDRIVKAENAISLDTLDKLSSALGLFSWQLLTPGLDISNPPHIAISEAEIRLYQRLSSLAKSSSN